MVKALATLAVASIPLAFVFVVIVRVADAFASISNAL